MQLIPYWSGSNMKATIMTKALYPWCLVPCCILALAFTGCSSLTTAKNKNGKKDSNWSFFKKKEYQIPHSMNVTWTYDIFTKEGKQPTRGFGGRLYFYNEKSQAIPVDGELTVYGFDDTERSHDGSSIESADKKFRFTPEQFTSHFSESELGASYSIWIPWDAAPGMQKKIMLIPTFKSKDGPVIRGNSATVILPGITPPDSQQRVIQASAQGGVQRASHTGARNPVSNPQGLNNPSPRTTTIQLPNRGYSARPVLSPEQAAALLQQIQSQEPQQPDVPLMLPTSLQPDLTNSAVGQSAGPSADHSVSHSIVPATLIASPMPSFHNPAVAFPKMSDSPGGFNASALPGFAPASAGQPPVHSEPSRSQAPTGASVPSSAYRPR